MALVYNVDDFSRRSRRHGTSGRRRTTTKYDKYGYQVTTMGSSSSANGADSVMHVLRVQPGVVVNVIDTPSSSRNHSWTSPRVVEYNSNPKKYHSHGSDGPRDSPWSTTHSPHPRSLDLFDDRGPPNSFAGFEEPTPPPDPRRSPRSHHLMPEEHYPNHIPEPYYPETHYPEAHYSEAHYPETHYPEAHYPETHYPVEPHESPRHAPSPIDIPIHSHPSKYSDYSLHSPCISDSDSGAFNHRPMGEPGYFDTHHSSSPIDAPIQISPPGRTRSHSFDFSSSGQPPSPLGSSSNNRTVRFMDNPVLPSPPVRRKGWWNRKGEQLWNNDGAYATAPEHDQYPPDLQGYPEPGTGWMNEEGVQIDMRRRLVRKKPLRSALKKSSSF